MSAREVTLSRSEFEASWNKLVGCFRSASGNEASVECVGCERCHECTFCRNSKGLVQCHFCVDSERCHSSTHCRASRDLVGCNHCVDCDRCIGSSYLYRSADCTNCTYCFGCIGLSKKDFHILNQPYDRSTYFAVTARLLRDLGMR